MSFLNDPLSILLVGAVIGGAFGLGVARANIVRGVDMRKSIRIALLATTGGSIAVYLVVTILRWIL